MHVLRSLGTVFETLMQLSKLFLFIVVALLIVVVFSGVVSATETKPVVQASNVQMLFFPSWDIVLRM